MPAAEEDAATEQAAPASAPTPPANSPAPAPPPVFQFAPPPPRRSAPVVSRSDLLGAVSVLSLIAVLGLPLGWLWAWLAPVQLSLVQADGTLVPLPTESQHRFDDLAVFVLLGMAAGLLTGLAVWLLRQRRGPLTLLALVAGSLVAAWLAVRTGVSFADGRYADAVRQASSDTVVAAAPRLESTWVIVVEPLFAVLAYGVAVAANGMDDLGRRLS